ncbi:cytochrome c4 [Gilvimarinus agarilyticus]|uniref:c-type cytochrome n=1 Tax=unclassified Gilvimarinus TaxID=2642066 RepID=UPI001C08FEE0|nr:MULTISPECIES: c-type cytochrome [unclassified Gilvimarinus]MBU2884315.1 cytochrome c4 [Gilvimarinus agarilyticus]MDO6569454.1 c-type cytochrome [Gilvimarinus sp. 2_MG-2023]MDO6747611.1 c-type cytochrome [Gilvimarinus sp. 1_MG-2023]
MKKLVLPLLIALGAPTLSQMASAAGDAAAGAEKVAVCAACHGPDGNSPAPSFPKIAGLGEAYIYKQLQDIQAWDNASGDDKAKTGRPVVEMTGMLSGLSDQDLQDIAAHYASQGMQLTGSKEFTVKINSGAEVSSLDLGENIYRGGNMETGVPACSGCHSPTGLGNAPAAYPRLGGQYAEYIEKQLKAFRGGERTNDGDQMIMRLVAKNMSDAEIKAVANYIAGLN